MYLFVLPVSGGGFVSQLAILQHLCESELVPDLTLSSSGGNVAAYVAAAADWKWAGIERISRELLPHLFARPWSSIPMLASIIGYFEGNTYRRGSGVKDFLMRNFTPQTITKYEIWTGTYNRVRQRACLFCNRSQANSIVNTSCIDHNLTQSMEPIFTGGDIDILAKAGIASASIPAIVPAELIEGEPYADGGIAGASPLSIMQEAILKYIRDYSAPLHIIYINSVDLSRPDLKPGHNLIDTVKQATSDLIRSQNVIDRLAGYKLLRCNPGDINKEEFVCNYDNLERVKQIQNKVRFSMLEIYPTNPHNIDIVNFSGEDVVKAIKAVYGHCRCRFWWLTPPQSPCDNDVCELLTMCKNCDVSQ